MGDSKHLPPVSAPPSAVGTASAPRPAPPAQHPAQGHRRSPRRWRHPGGAKKNAFGGRKLRKKLGKIGKCQENIGKIKKTLENDADKLKKLGKQVDLTNRSSASICRKPYGFTHEYIDSCECFPRVWEMTGNG